MLQAVLGIDPGVTGNLTKITEDRKVSSFNMANQSDHKIMQWIFHECVVGHQIHGLIERVNARKGDSPVTAFGLGGAYRAVRMVLTCFSLRYDYVEPKTWQYEFNLGGPQGPPGCSQKEEYNARKEAHYRYALTLFPWVTKTGADGSLIAEYMWRQTFGELQNVEKNWDGVRRGTGVVSVSAPRIR